MVKVSYHETMGWRNIQPSDRTRLKIINEWLKAIDNVKNSMVEKDPNDNSVLKNPPKSRAVRKNIKNMTQGQLIDYLNSLTKFMHGVYKTLGSLENKQYAKEKFDNVDVSPKAQLKYAADFLSRKDITPKQRKEVINAAQYIGEDFDSDIKRTSNHDWKTADKSQKANKKRFVKLNEAQAKLTFLSGVYNSDELTELTGIDSTDFNKMSLNEIISFINKIEVLTRKVLKNKSNN